MHGTSFYLVGLKHSTSAVRFITFERKFYFYKHGIPCNQMFY